MYNPLNESIKLGVITVGNLAYNQAMLNWTKNTTTSLINNQDEM